MRKEGSSLNMNQNLEGGCMKWRAFFQIVSLIIITAFVYYFVTPKYFFSFSRTMRANRFNGKVERYYNSKWHTLEDIEYTSYSKQKTSFEKENPFSGIIEDEAKNRFSGILDDYRLLEQSNNDK